MILSDIRTYLQHHGKATLHDLAVHFDAEPEAMRGMLEQWIRKGRVARHRLQSGCGHGCAACTCNPLTEIYEWRPSA